MSETPAKYVIGSAMADVADKPVTRRRALASGHILLGPEAFALASSRKLPKGDALALAEFAGWLKSLSAPASRWKRCAVRRWPC
jgi:molybdenum cofactor biosynthesis enzyme